MNYKIGYQGIIEEHKKIIVALVTPEKFDRHQDEELVAVQEIPRTKNRIDYLTNNLTLPSIELY